MEISDRVHIHPHILQLELEGFVTRTFRRLDSERQQAILIAILDKAAAKGPTAGQEVPAGRGVRDETQHAIEAARTLDLPEAILSVETPKGCAAYPYLRSDHSFR